MFGAVSLTGRWCSCVCFPSSPLCSNHAFRFPPSLINLPCMVSTPTKKDPKKTDASRDYLTAYLRTSASRPVPLLLLHWRWGPERREEDHQKARPLRHQNPRRRRGVRRMEVQLRSDELLVLPASQRTFARSDATYMMT